MLHETRETNNVILSLTHIYIIRTRYIIKSDASWEISATNHYKLWLFITNIYICKHRNLEEKINQFSSLLKNMTTEINNNNILCLLSFFFQILPMIINWLKHVSNYSPIILKLLVSSRHKINFLYIHKQQYKNPFVIDILHSITRHISIS